MPPSDNVAHEHEPDAEPPSPTLSFSQARVLDRTMPPARLVCPRSTSRPAPLSDGRPVEPGAQARPPAHAVGIPGKWYSRSDRITPVIDAMSRLHKHTLIDDCCFGIFDKRQPTAAERAAKEAAARDRAAAAKHRASTNGWVCIMCGNTNRHSLTETHEALVCQCGATHPRTVATHREKACAQEDDKTQHADALGQQPDRNPAIPDFERARPETAESGARRACARCAARRQGSASGVAHAQSALASARPPRRRRRPRCGRWAPFDRCASRSRWARSSTRSRHVRPLDAHRRRGRHAHQDLRLQHVPRRRAPRARVRRRVARCARAARRRR